MNVKAFPQLCYTPDDVEMLFPHLCCIPMELHEDISLVVRWFYTKQDGLLYIELLMK